MANGHSPVCARGGAFRIYDAAGGQTRQLDAGDVAPVNPRVSGDHVVWQGGHRRSG